MLKNDEVDYCTKCTVKPIVKEHMCGSVMMMNREIKFRAWEKNLKEMIPVEEIDFNSLMINQSTAWRFIDEVELMQNTGLKDKNGTEIYEGDIVLDKLNNEYGEVVFDEGCFLVLWQEGQNTVYQATREFYIEVVGNVYENKNLLRSE